MAKAETATPAKPDVILTLTYDEASMLKCLLGNHIGGTGVNRDMSDCIYEALKPHIQKYGSLKADNDFHTIYLR